jgi:hypothetical protein
VIVTALEIVAIAAFVVFAAVIVTFLFRWSRTG